MRHTGDGPKQVKYEGEVYEVLYSVAGCVVLVNVATGKRVTTSRRKVVLIK